MFWAGCCLCRAVLAMASWAGGAVGDLQVSVSASSAGWWAAGLLSEHTWVLLLPRAHSAAGTTCAAGTACAGPHSCPERVRELWPCSRSRIPAQFCQLGGFRLCSDCLELEQELSVFQKGRSQGSTGFCKSPKLDFAGDWKLQKQDPKFSF